MPETTTRIPLPGDQWADLVGPDDMTGGDVERALTLVDLGGFGKLLGLDVVEPGEAPKPKGSLSGDELIPLMARVMPQLNRVLVVVLTRSWSLTGDDGEPLLVTMETVAAQRMALLHPLYAHVAPARAELMQGLGFGGVDDPKSAAT